MLTNDEINHEEQENETYSEEMCETEEQQPNEDESITTDDIEINENIEDEKQLTEQQHELEHEQKLTRLPLARIKNIMKMDPDVNLTSQEAVFLVAKATELFIGSLARETFAITFKNKKKTMQRKDLDAAIEAVDALCFLEGTLD